MGELPPHLSIHRKISFPPLLCPVQTLLKNQTDSGFTSPTKRQTINRQLFHRPAAFILFRFTIQIGGKASYVKLCLHWSCNLVETNLSLIALLGNKWPAIETKLKSVFLYPTKMNSFRRLQWKYVYWGWVWKYMQRRVGIYINRCKHIFFITGRNFLRIKDWKSSPSDLILLDLFRIFSLSWSFQEI